MRRALPKAPLLAAALLAAGCTPSAVVPDADRLRVTRELEGARRWLKVALFVGPFFSDPSRALASDQPFSEIELLETPGGRNIVPPRADKVLLPGTPVVVKDVEFPSPWLIARRPVMTPRYHAWLRLEVAGESRPLLVVLPQNLATFDDVRVELDRYLATTDVGPELQALTEVQRKAVERKAVTEGMGPGALVMAWGYPEKKVVDRPAGTEHWIWPTGRRRAWLERDQLVRFESR